MSDVKTYDVVVCWADDPTWLYPAKVAIDPDWTSKDDDETVFFYFSSEEEYRECLKNGTDDFTIEEV